MAEQPDESVEQPLVEEPAVGVPLNSSRTELGKEEDDSLPYPSVNTVSWWRQLRCLMRKNMLLLWRRPVMLAFMMFSSVFAVLISWPAARQNSTLPPLTDCGTIPAGYLDGLSWEEQVNTALSLNDRWRSGLPVAILALGPMVTAVAAFIIVHNEIQMKMLGVLRGLGTRESVYWMSWFLPFMLVALINSFLGTVAAKLVPIHAYEQVYFGGIMASFFALQVALVPASFFLAAVCGTARKRAIWLILIMMVAVWIPVIVMTSQGWAPTATSIEYFSQSPAGLFWVNMNTTREYTNYDVDTGNETVQFCNIPIMNEYQGTLYKTEEQQQEVGEDEYFVGCFAAAGSTSTMWNTDTTRSKVGLAALFLIPYTHFTTIWGNYAGMTAMPNRNFGASDSSKSPEQLAIDSLPVPPNQDNAMGTSAFPQGSTLQLDDFYDYDSNWLYDENGNYVGEQLDTCPDANRTGANFCDSMSHCDHAREPSPTKSPSVNAMIGYLVALGAIYMLLAAYIAQVFSGHNGSSKPFYFFLLPSYWCIGCGRKRKRDDTASLQEAPSTNVGVEVDNVTKKYGDFAALNGVSLRMERGEVTALLGQNGAGKTTLANLIGCEQLPTEGDVYVFGHSVTHEPDVVRRLIGVCKQDDYLWPDLSAKEHLELYAGLRGVEPSEQAETVQKWLESVDLDTVQFQFSAGFSGGMKRRLSVALSTIGNAPLVIFDEPSTGMDPVSRRFVWRHLDEIKEGRVVLLTTHAMEEADLLSDMVAIVRKGQLAAFGSPLELKSAHGSALQFSILVEKSDVTATEATIRRHFATCAEWVTVEANETGNLTVNIHAVKQNDDEDGVDVALLSNFVGWLENDDRFDEYGFSNSSLEEVFLKVTGEGLDDDEEANNELDDVDVCCDCCKPSCIRRCLSGPCRCCCCPRPRLDEESAGGAETTNASNIASFKPVLTVRRQLAALLVQCFTRHWTGKSSIGNWIMFTLFVVVTFLMGFVYAGAYDPIPGQTLPTAFISLMLLSIINPIYSDRHAGLFYLMRSQGMLKRSYLLGMTLYAFIVQFIYGVLMLSLYYASALFRETVVCGYDDEGACDDYHEFGDPPRDYPTSISSYDAGVYNGENVELSAVRTAGGYAKLLGTAAFFALTLPGAALASSYLPGHKFAMTLVAFLILVASVAPLIKYFFPMENEYYLECLRTIDPNSMCDSTFTGAGNSQEFLNCVGLQVNSASISSLCMPTYAAILPQFGVFQTIATTLLSDIKFVSETPGYVEQVLIPSLSSGGADCSGNTCQFPYAQTLYWQNVGFILCGAVILLILGFIVATVFGFPTGWILQAKTCISRAVGCLSCRLFGRSRRSWKEKQSQANGEEEELEEVTTERALVNDIMRPLLEKTSDVEAGSDEEPALIDHASIPREELPPVLMHKLRKVYPSLGGLAPKVALESLDLHVPKGQVLGLLGKNGAGKSSVLKILSTFHDSSGGLALVAGYDVSCERVSVFERLGNCPQFDVVWASRSVRHHLEFFARLKGLPKGQVKACAHSIATAVGLGTPEVYRRNAGQLSGGMRRRLSIAIALIGAPAVLVLDEPTTGLDPSTTNSIWGLVNSFATEDRAIIITTHMMVEADTLCNRIAILSKGRLKVVATQQRLKDRFGSGYLLQLNLVRSSPANQERAMDFVRSRLHKDAKLETKQAKTLRVSLPRDLDLERVFAALYSPESTSEGGINQFLLSQSSLEDVFIALGD